MENRVETSSREVVSDANYLFRNITNTSLAQDNSIHPQTLSMANSISHWSDYAYETHKSLLQREKNNELPPESLKEIDDLKCTIGKVLRTFDDFSYQLVAIKTQRQQQSDCSYVDAETALLTLLGQAQAKMTQLQELLGKWINFELQPYLLDIGLGILSEKSEQYEIDYNAYYPMMVSTTPEQRRQLESAIDNKNEEEYEELFVQLWDNYSTNHQSKLGM